MRLEKLNITLDNGVENRSIGKPFVAPEVSPIESCGILGYVYTAIRAVLLIPNDIVCVAIDSIDAKNTQ